MPRSQASVSAHPWHRWRVGGWRLLPIPAVCCYLASGVLLLVGMALVLMPLIGSQAAVTGILRLLAAIIGYEALLLGLSLLVGGWRRCREDTRSLLVISVLLLTATAITADTLAVDGPLLALSTGGGLLLWAGLRFWLLQRRLRLRWPRRGGPWVVAAWLASAAAAGLVGLIVRDAAALSPAPTIAWLGAGLPWSVATLALIVQGCRREAGIWARLPRSRDPVRARYLGRALLVLIWAGLVLRHELLRQYFLIELPPVGLPFAWVGGLLLLRSSLRAADLAESCFSRWLDAAVPLSLLLAAMWSPTDSAASSWWQGALALAACVASAAQFAFARVERRASLRRWAEASGLLALFCSLQLGGGILVEVAVFLFLGGYLCWRWCWCRNPSAGLLIGPLLGLLLFRLRPDWLVAGGEVVPLAAAGLLAAGWWLALVFVHRLRPGFALVGLIGSTGAIWSLAMALPPWPAWSLLVLLGSGAVLIAATSYRYGRGGWLLSLAPLVHGAWPIIASYDLSPGWLLIGVSFGFLPIGLFCSWYRRRGELAAE